MNRNLQGNGSVSGYAGNENKFGGKQCCNYQEK